MGEREKSNSVNSPWQFVVYLLLLLLSLVFSTPVVGRERSLLLFFDCTGLSSHFPPTSFFLGVVVGAAVSLSQHR